MIHCLLTWKTDFRQSAVTAQALGFIPSNVKNLNPTALPTLFISMFLHADLTHLIANILFLLVFGRKVETQLQATDYLAFYLAAGVTAGMIHALIDPDSSIPLIGANVAFWAHAGGFLMGGLMAIAIYKCIPKEIFRPTT